MRLQRRLDIGTIAKLLGGALVLLAIGLTAGFLLARRQTLECTDALSRARTKAASATSALSEETKRCEQLNQKRDSSRVLVEARARLFQALIEVHGKNFGLASRHLAAAKQQIEATRDAWPEEAERAKLAQLADQLSDLHERTMLLDPGVVDKLQGLAAALQVFVDGTPS